MKPLLGCLCLLVGFASALEDVTDLVKQLKSEDPEARRSAAKALAEMGPQARDAVPALTETLKDKDLFVRRFSAQALGAIGPEAKSAIPALVGALGESRKEMVVASARALGQLGPDGIKSLADILKDRKRDLTLRRKATESLGASTKDAKSAVPVLIEALGDTSIRVEAASSLG